MKITPAQARMARAGLGWNIPEVAKRVGVHTNTVSRFENGGVVMAETEKGLRVAYEKAGVRFTRNGCVCPPSEE